MNIDYYNAEIDKILESCVSIDSLTKSDLKTTIDFVATTIHQYNKKLKLQNLTFIVGYLVKKKYNKLYFLNSNATTTKPTRTNAVCESIISNKSDSDIMSLDSEYLDSDCEKENDDIQLNSYLDLISHKHDYEADNFAEKKYMRRQNNIELLKQIPQHEQKSTEWLMQRHECLTATAISQALDEDPYKYPIELLLDKCNRGKPFVENENVHHGKKYEEIGNMFYGFRNNIKLAEYGLIQHPTHKFIGASPDGICEYMCLHNDGLSKLVGRLLEIKFPKRRKICTTGELDGDICPHYYFVQVQTQLYVTNMDECDFLQCEMHEYESLQEYIEDTHPTINGWSKTTNLEKGCLIQLLPKKMISNTDKLMCLYNAKYIYPPKMHMTLAEIKDWIADQTMNYYKHPLANEYMIDRVIYWRLSKVACHLIKADTKWFESKIPVLKQFWKYILFYRDHQNKLSDLVEYVNDVGVSKTSDIFEKIHNDYLKKYPSTKFKPLYTTPTEWRIKYNKKHESYKKFMDFQASKKNFAINAAKKKSVSAKSTNSD